MRLTKISAINFKGRGFEYELPPKLAIVGQNFVGKSAVIDAIRWLLMGYVPEVGKLNSALWEYSSGDFMEVKGKTDTGYMIARRLESVRGSIKASGSAELSLIPGLNAEHYFGLSDRDRVNYVFSAVPTPKEFSTDTLLVELDNISIEGLAPEDIQGAKKQLAPACGKLVNESIDAAISELREQYTYWNKREKDTIGAVRTLTELKLREKEISSETLAENEKELTTLGSELVKLTEKIGNFEVELERFRNVEESRSRYNRIIKADTSHSDEIKGLEKLIGEAGSKMKPLHTEKEFEQLQAQIKHANARRDELLAQFSAALGKTNGLTFKLTELKKLKVCPYCHSDKEGWKKRVEAELTAELALASGVRDGSTIALRQIETSLAALREQEKSETAARLNNVALASNMRLWEREITSLKKAEAAFSEERERAKKALAELPDKEAPSENDLAELRRQREELRKKTAETQTRHSFLLKLQQDLRRAAESEQEHNRAVATVKVIKKATEILQERKKAMVEIVFGELLKTANAIFGGILKSPIALFDNTIGRWEGSKFIPHRVFSGTEKALCYCAISAALSARAPMKLAIIDEFQRLDRDNQAKAITALSAAVDNGTLEQFIVVATELSYGDWQIHSVSDVILIKI